MVLKYIPKPFLMYVHVHVREDWYCSTCMYCALYKIFHSVWLLPWWRGVTGRSLTGYGRLMTVYTHTHTCTCMHLLMVYKCAYMYSTYMYMQDTYTYMYMYIVNATFKRVLHIHYTPTAYAHTCTCTVHTFIYM